MHMADQGQQDDKIIAVHLHDPAFEDYEDLDQLPGHTMREIRRFFKDYKALEKKEVEVEELGDANQALRVVTEALELYQKEENRLRGWR